MKRRRFSLGLCSCSIWTLAGCAPTGTPAGRDQGTGFLRQGYRPLPDTDEANLWYAVAKAESDLQQSRFVLRDRDLNDYVRDIACRVGGEHCRDLRIYIVRTPEFNASMAPNGMMQIWTGLLMRCHNEAQLAAVIGHEMGHYLRQHTLERFRDVRAKADFGAFLGMGLAVAGLGIAGSLAQLALIASIYGFSRDQEREADTIGLELISRAGYAPGEASRVWEQLIAEQNASTVAQENDIFFATHPSEDERATTLRQLATAKIPASTSPIVGSDSYQKSLGSIRSMLFEDELRLQRYGRSEVVFDRLLVDAPSDGALWYYLGELYRRRAADGDASRAETAYANAIRHGGPAEANRSLGVLRLRAGDRAGADQALRRYLELYPNAPDRLAIEDLLTKGS